MLGSKWGDKCWHLAGRAEEHIVIQSREDRAAHCRGHEAEGMGIRAGCKGGVEKDLRDELDWEHGPDGWGEWEWWGRSRK